jgi:hypothetical protein
VASYDAARTSHPENSSTDCSLRIGNCLTSVSAASGALGRHHRLARWVADNGDLWRRGRATWPSQPRAMAISTTATLGQVSWAWTHLTAQMARSPNDPRCPSPHPEGGCAMSVTSDRAKAAIERGIRQKFSFVRAGISTAHAKFCRPTRERVVGWACGHDERRFQGWHGLQRRKRRFVGRATRFSFRAAGWASGVLEVRVFHRRFWPARAQSMGRSFSCQQRESQELKRLSPSSASEGWP